MSPARASFVPADARDGATPGRLPEPSVRLLEAAAVLGTADTVGCGGACCGRRPAVRGDRGTRRRGTRRACRRAGRAFRASAGPGRDLPGSRAGAPGASARRSSATSLEDEECVAWATASRRARGQDAAGSPPTRGRSPRAAREAAAGRRPRSGRSRRPPVSARCAPIASGGCSARWRPRCTAGIVRAPAHWPRGPRTSRLAPLLDNALAYVALGSGRRDEAELRLRARVGGGRAGGRRRADGADRRTDGVPRGSCGCSATGRRRVVSAGGRCRYYQDKTPSQPTSWWLALALYWSGRPR